MVEKHTKIFDKETFPQYELLETVPKATILFTDYSVELIKMKVFFFYPAPSLLVYLVTFFANC